MCVSRSTFAIKIAQVFNFHKCRLENAVQGRRERNTLEGRLSAEYIALDGGNAFRHNVVGNTGSGKIGYMSIAEHKQLAVVVDMLTRPAELFKVGAMRKRSLPGDAECRRKINVFQIRQTGEIVAGNTDKPFGENKLLKSRSNAVVQPEAGCSNRVNTLRDYNFGADVTYIGNNLIVQYYSVAVVESMGPGKL